MMHAVIMAGGSGTRFWPESRAARPKQLLRLASEQTMIEATLARLDDIVPMERVLVATGAHLVEPIARQLPLLPRTSILGEPCRRDTAPCIGMAALKIVRADPDATMLVMPADHAIADEQAFRRAIDYADRLIEATAERIVTFGIRPTYPAAIFGYIQRGSATEPLAAGGEDAPATYHVKKFREKPSAEVAREYLESGEFYWNSGIFVWRARVILAALARYEPTMFEHLRRIDEADETADYQQVLEREFTAIKGMSIDYAVMERATDVVVIEAPFDWDDVGSWRSLARLHGSDDDGNTVLARHVGLETTGSIIRGERDHLIATLGLEDCIVVHTPDATLVANKRDEESIRRLVELIKERGWQEYL